MGGSLDDAEELFRKQCQEYIEEERQPIEDLIH